MLLTGSLLCISVLLHAQPCSTTFIQFTSQEDIDNFALEYSGCTTWKGLIKIGPSDDIVDLSGLQQIKRIEGTLNISYNDSLADLSTLSHLEWVDFFYLKGNDFLTTLNGLSSLEVIANRLYIEDELTLANIDAINALDTVRGLTIKNCPKLDSVSFQVPMDTMSDLSISHCQGLKYVKGFKDLKHLVGDFYFTYNDSMSELPQFENLVSVTGRFVVFRQGLLSSLLGFDSLRYTRTFSVADNYNLELLANFERLKVSDNILIQSNSRLKELRGFNDTDSLRLLEVQRNDSLKSIDAFHNLVTMQYLIFFENPNLDSIYGFDKLQVVKEQLRMSGIGVKSFDFFEQLHSIEFQTLVFAIGIASNEQLVNLNGLENLFEVSGQVSISANANLLDISSLSNIDPTKVTKLSIAGSPHLSDCVNDFVCEYLRLEKESSIGSNAPGCNSKEEILAACEILNNSDIEQGDLELVVYPNPATSIVELQIGDVSIAPNYIALYDMSGRTYMMPYVDGEGYDVASLPSGLYQLLLQRQGKVHAARLMKM